MLLQQLKGVHVKGIPFVNKRCTKGVLPFLPKIVKMVHDRVRGRTSLGSLPLLEVL